MDHMPLQFGRALLHILWRIMGSNPALGPVYLLKIDLVDGFYCIFLAPRHIPIIGVAVLTALGTPRLVAFLLALPMGWTNSPPFFCTATKTVTNLTNATLDRGQAQPPHCLKEAANLFPADGTQIATHDVPPLCMATEQPKPPGVMSLLTITWCLLRVHQVTSNRLAAC